MSKKIISLILAALLCMTVLVSCSTGSTGDKSTEGSETTGTTGSTETGNGSESATATEAYKPGPDENADVSSIYSANFTFTNAEIAYAIQSSYQNILYNSQYYGGPSVFGIDVSKSLKEQTCIFDVNGGSWFDYFLGEAKSTATEVLALCEAAKAAGFTLPAEATSAIDSTLASYTTSAQKESMTLDEYLTSNLGYDITSDVLRSVLEKSYLAQYYMNDIISKLDLSDDKLEEAYNANPKLADTVDFLILAFDPLTLLQDDAESSEEDETSAEAESTYTEEELKDALNFCRTEASAIAKAESKDAFIEAATASLTKGFGMSAEDAAKALESGEYTSQAYQSDVVTDKIFSCEEGETFVIEDETESVVYVGILLKKNGRDESSATRDVRHILFKHDTYKDDTVVNQVYNEWVAGGASVEDFIKLAKEYSEDPGSATNGGLYEGVKQGEMVDEFNDWLFDEARVEGDHAIVKSASYGWHIMYFEADGEPAWKEAIRTALKSKASEQTVEDATSTYSVTMDDELLASIPA